MRARLLLPTTLAVLGACVSAARAQPPAVTFELKLKSPAGPPDEEKEILKEIKEAYKAPFEVHEDVLKELRRQYEQPTPQREEKIFKELRRLYDLTPQQEEV